MKCSATKFTKYVVIVLAVIILSHCRPVTLADLRDHHSPDRLVLEKEFEKHPDMDCGPYVVYSLLKYYFPRKEFDAQVYEKMDLTRADELVQYLREKGLEAELKSANLTILRTHLLAEDIPVVFIRQSRFSDYGHYALFRGYDFEKGRVFLTDESRDYTMPLYTFLRAWERGDKFIISVTHEK